VSKEPLRGPWATPSLGPLGLVPRGRYAQKSARGHASRAPRYAWPRYPRARTSRPLRSSRPRGPTHPCGCAPPSMAPRLQRSSRPIPGQRCAWSLCARSSLIAWLAGGHPWPLLCASCLGSFIYHCPGAAPPTRRLLASLASRISYCTGRTSPPLVPAHLLGSPPPPAPPPAASLPFPLGGRLGPAGRRPWLLNRRPAPPPPVRILSSCIQSTSSEFEYIP